jgi:hypothetical protein
MRMRMRMRVDDVGCTDLQCAANFCYCWCRRKIKGSKQRGVMQEAAVFGKRAPYYWKW